MALYLYRSNILPKVPMRLVYHNLGPDKSEPLFSVARARWVIDRSPRPYYETIPPRPQPLRWERMGGHQPIFDLLSQNCVKREGDLGGGRCHSAPGGRRSSCRPAGGGTSSRRRTCGRPAATNSTRILDDRSSSGDVGRVYSQDVVAFAERRDAANSSALSLRSDNRWEYLALASEFFVLLTRH